MMFFGNVALWELAEKKKPNISRVDLDFSQDLVSWENVLRHIHQSIDDRFTIIEAKYCHSLSLLPLIYKLALEMEESLGAIVAELKSMRYAE